MTKSDIREVLEVREQLRQEVIDKACEYLEDHLRDVDLPMTEFFIIGPNYMHLDRFVELFRKALEE